MLSHDNYFYYSHCLYKMHQTKKCQEYFTFAKDILVSCTNLQLKKYIPSHLLEWGKQMNNGKALAIGKEKHTCDSQTDDSRLDRSNNIDSKEEKNNHEFIFKEPQQVFTVWYRMSSLLACCFLCLLFVCCFAVFLIIISYVLITICAITTEIIHGRQRIAKF